MSSTEVKTYRKKKRKTDNYRNSFFAKTVLDWNKLCDSVVNAKTVDTFKTAVSKSD